MRHTPIHDMPTDELVDGEYIVSQGCHPLSLMLLMVPLGRFPRPTLVRGVRHWRVRQILEWYKGTGD